MHKQVQYLNMGILLQTHNYSWVFFSGFITINIEGEFTMDFITT
jgi:hypothetical protein